MLWHFVEHTQCVHGTRPERAYCTTRAPSRHAGPTVLARSAASRHALPFSQLRAKPPLAAPGRPSASRRRRPTASAHVGAAEPSSARHLAPGTARAHPRVCPLALVAATSPWLQRGGSPEGLSMAAAEPTSTSYKKRTPNPFKHTGNLRMLP